MSGLRWIALVATVVVVVGCKTTRDHLDVLEQIYDEDYNLQSEILYRPPTERLLSVLEQLLTDRPSEPQPIRIKNPGMLCQRSILGLGRSRGLDAAEYGRAISILAPISVNGENALARAYALDLMVFLHSKYQDRSIEPPVAGRKIEDAEAAIDELTVQLDAYREDPTDAEVEARCRDALGTLGEVSFTTYGDAAAVLRLLAGLHPSRTHTVFREPTSRGVYRVAPQAIRLCLVSALSPREELFVREEAMEGLGILENPIPVTRILALLTRDPSAEVRRKSAQALGRIGGSSALTGLVEALELDADAGVRRYAEDALEQITGESFGPDPSRWRNWIRNANREARGGES